MEFFADVCVCVCVCVCVSICRHELFESLKIWIVTLESSIIRTIKFPRIFRNFSIVFTTFKWCYTLSMALLYPNVKFVASSDPTITTTTTPINWNLGNANHIKLFRPTYEWFQLEMPTPLLFIPLQLRSWA